MTKPHTPPDLGFDLKELEEEVDRYQAPPPKPKRRKPRILNAPSPRKIGKRPSPGRPKSVPDGRRCTFLLTEEQYLWLLKEAARRTIREERRYDTSALLRELIDQARGKS